MVLRSIAVNDVPLSSVSFFFFSSFLSGGGATASSPCPCHVYLRCLRTAYATLLATYILLATAAKLFWFDSYAEFLISLDLFLRDRRRQSEADTDKLASCCFALV